jgi:hypothetical protein
MIGMKNYMNAYVDRRMKSVVEEWDLSRKDNITDFTERSMLSNRKSNA